MSQYRQVQDICMDGLILEHKFKYQARLHVERMLRLKADHRSTTVGGGARKEALENADKPLRRSNLDTSKNQVQMLCRQAIARAGMLHALSCLSV